MKYLHDKVFTLKLSLILLSVFSIAMADTTPEWTQRYQIQNDTGDTISNVVTYDYVLFTGSDTGFYKDPELKVSSLANGVTYPTDLSQGGMVSYIGGNFYSSHWNGWTISYNTPSKCYRSSYIGSGGGIDNLSILNWETNIPTINAFIWLNPKGQVHLAFTNGSSWVETIYFNLAEVPCDAEK